MRPRPAGGQGRHEAFAARAPGAAMTLVFRGVRHAYGANQVLKGVDLTVAPGEIVCLLGASGCGKTTLLRLAAGLEPLQEGRIELGGQVIAEPGREVPPERRGVGFVFQDYALFPHLTVAENVAFGLRFAARGERAARVADALERVGLTSHRDAFPHMLSGGQQQRVALARALAPLPSVLLLDEAFASLDTRLREQVRDDTLHVLQTAGIATLLVTHDSEEAMFMADRIALMREGRILQLGTPEALYFSPADRYVATFLGEVNRLPARVREGRAETALGSLPAKGLAEATAAEVLVRPEGLCLGSLEGEVAEVEACRLLGASTMVHLALPDGQGGVLHLHARLQAGRRLARGDRVTVGLDPERAFVFPLEAS